MRLPISHRDSANGCVEWRVVPPDKDYSGEYYQGERYGTSLLVLVVLVAVQYSYEAGRRGFRAIGTGCRRARRV